jgi:lipopolysaccharide transport system ATP-binding protein
MRIISCQRVSKTFHRNAGQKLMRDHLADAFRKRTREHDFYALKNVTFEMMNGESLAVVGGNGAGKSTLLSLVTGLAKPDEGRLEVNGKIAALLELGSGFHPDLTGAENLRLNAALLGFTRKQTDAMFDSIVEFSGVGEFIDEPLRTYSSGMGVRLAFSVAVNLDPDILIVDEVLAVGDQAFQAKCFERIRELRRSGKSLLFVSHNATMVLELCDRALWLDHGQLVMQGAAASVIEAYQVEVTHGPPILSG